MKKNMCFAFLTMIQCLAAADAMTVSRTGDEVRIESPFPGGYTLVRTGCARGSNKQFNFNDARLNKEGGASIYLKNCIDDACPWNLNSTYIGANHGDSSASGIIFREPHGLTEKDCGSEWKDARGRKFYVLKIESPTVFWVLSENLSKDKDIWKFTRPSAKGTLTHEDGRVLKDFRVEFRQLRPQVRILGRNYFADGKPLEENTPVKCGIFTVEEEYDIVATDAVLEHVRSNPGKQVDFNAPGLDPILTQKITYSFYPDASCIVEHNVRFHRDVRLSYMGFMQAMQMKKGKYGKHLYYIPKTLPFEYDGQEWDFANQVDFTRPIKRSILLKKETFENPESMPDRFIQYLEDAPGQPDVGFVCGYSLVEGCTVPEQRSRNASTALFLYKSHKTYPHAIDGGKLSRIKAGQTFRCVIYRQYFDPDQGYYMNRQGGDHVMYVDFHEPVSGKKIPLPEKVRSMSMETLERSATVQFRREGADLIFDSTGKNGYCVLKFR